MLNEPLGNHLPARLLGKVFFAFAGARNRLYDTFPGLGKRVPFRVVSVGGIHAGGTGKTPLALLVVQCLEEAGIPTVLASRGFRRTERASVVSPPGAGVSWQEVGDEPAMVRRNAPSCWLAIGTRRAEAIGAGVGRFPSDATVVLDDGFQHRRLARDMDIVCLPPGAFNDLPIPAGRLREPISNLSRASVFCCIGDPDRIDDLERQTELLGRWFPQRPRFILVRTPGSWVRLGTGEIRDDPPFRRPVLVTGIARPRSFESIVASQGIIPAATRYFPDHHRYTEPDLHVSPQEEVDAVATTEKDAIKIERLKLVNAPAIWYLKVSLKFIDPYTADDFAAVLQESTSG